MSIYPINIPSPRPRHILLIALLIGITIIRFSHKLGDAYTTKLYPFIGRTLTTLSNPIPFSIDGLFIALCLAGLITYPIYAIAHEKTHNTAEHSRISALDLCLVLLRMGT